MYTTGWNYTMGLSLIPCKWLQHYLTNSGVCLYGGKTNIWRARVFWGFFWHHTSTGSANLCHALNLAQRTYPLHVEIHERERSVTEMPLNKLQITAFSCCLINSFQATICGAMIGFEPHAVLWQDDATLLFVLFGFLFYFFYTIFPSNLLADLSKFDNSFSEGIKWNWCSGIFWMGTLFVGNVVDSHGSPGS